MGVIVDVLSNTASNHNGFPVVESTNDTQVPGPRQVDLGRLQSRGGSGLRPAPASPTSQGSRTRPCVPVKRHVGQVGFVGI